MMTHRIKRTGYWRHSDGSWRTALVETDDRPAIAVEIRGQAGNWVARTEYSAHKIETDSRTGIDPTPVDVVATETSAQATRNDALCAIKELIRPAAK